MTRHGPPRRALAGQSTAKIRRLLAVNASRRHPELRRLARGLTDAELGEAERFERLGKRRGNVLEALKAERQRRQGKTGRMATLRMEVRR